MKKDNIHYSIRKLDSYNKTWNFVVTERELGKTVCLGTKIYNAWKKKHRPSIILRRHVIDITSVYINDLQDTINDFLDEKHKIKFEYKRGSIKDGIVDITVNGFPFCRIISLSLPMHRIKSLRYDDPYGIFFDEYIINVRGGEKYRKDEVFTFKEIYNTFNRFATRHNHKLRTWFFGNPYSKYNPYFSWLDIDLTKIYPGAFIVGKDYVVDCARMKPELREQILKNNPLYEFSDDYTKYAFGAQAVNDENIIVYNKQPDGYRLKWIFRISNKNLGIFHKTMNRNRLTEDVGKFWIALLPNDYGTTKKIFAYDFNNLVNNSQLITNDIRSLTFRLKDAIGHRDVSYKSIEEAYLIEEIYIAL